MRRFSLLLLLILATPCPAAKIVLVAGGGDGKDGSPATQAKLVTPFGVDFDSKGRMYFVEMEKGERLRIVEDGNVKTVAGTGKKGDQIGAALESSFNGIHGLAMLYGDTVLIADTWNKRICSYANGKVEVYVGADSKSDGAILSKPPAGGSFGGIFSIAMAPGSKAGNMNPCVFTDLDNRKIYSIRLHARRVHLQHIAGNGKKGVPMDGGKSTEQPLFDPRAAAVDSEGNIYILERSGHSLRVVNNGIIKTVAGTGKAGTAVGKALESQMNGPKHCCCDKDGNVYIADAENHRILKYDPKAATVAVVAGSGKKGSAGLDGDPLKCELNRPHGVTVHPKTGELYICDSYNDRILKIVP